MRMRLLTPYTVSRLWWPSLLAVRFCAINQAWENCPLGTSYDSVYGCTDMRHHIWVGAPWLVEREALSGGW